MSRLAGWLPQPVNRNRLESLNSFQNGLIDYNGDPGAAVLLTGDGSGFSDGVGFHADLKRMHGKGWTVEVLSWRHSCARRMREWAEENGRFIALDDYYDNVTFLEAPAPGQPADAPRYAAEL